MIHKVKILLLAVLVFGFISCEGVEPPFAGPLYNTYTVELEVGAASVLGPTYVWNVYIMEGANDVLSTILTISAGQVSTESWKKDQRLFSMLKTKSEETFPVKWKLMSCSDGSA